MRSIAMIDLDNRHDHLRISRIGYNSGSLMVLTISK